MIKFEDILSNADELAANEKKALFEAFVNLVIVQLDHSVYSDDLMDCLSTICDDPRISVASFRWLLRFLREV